MVDAFGRSDSEGGLLNTIVSTNRDCDIKWTDTGGKIQVIQLARTVQTQIFNEGCRLYQIVSVSASGRTSLWLHIVVCISECLFPKWGDIS